MKNIKSILMVIIFFAQIQVSLTAMQAPLSTTSVPECLFVVFKNTEKNSRHCSMVSINLNNTALLVRKEDAEYIRRTYGDVLFFKTKTDQLEGNLVPVNCREASAFKVKKEVSVYARQVTFLDGEDYYW